MQKKCKIANLALFVKVSGFSSVNIFFIVFNSSALLNYLFYVILQIVRNLVFNIQVSSSANTHKPTKGAIYSALSNLKPLINC